MKMSKQLHFCIIASHAHFNHPATQVIHGTMSGTYFNTAKDSHICSTNTNTTLWGNLITYLTCFDGGFLFFFSFFLLSLAASVLYWAFLHHLFPIYSFTLQTRMVRKSKWLLQLIPQASSPISKNTAFDTLT